MVCRKSFRVAVTLYVALFLVVMLASPALADFQSSKRQYESQNYNDRIFLQVALILTGDYNGLADGIFGQNTYRSLLSFQREMGYRQTGVLTRAQRERLNQRAAAIYAELGVEFVEDAEAGVSLPIPTSVVSRQGRTERGSIWASPRDDIEIETVGIPADEQSYFDIYSRMIAERPARQVTYSTVQNGFFVVSGILDGRNFYLKFSDLGTDTRGFSISWSPEADVLGARLSILLASLASPLSRQNTGAPGQQTARKDREAEAQETVAFGTGFFVSREGLVVTNAHVVESCSSIAVLQYPLASVNLLGKDEDKDLALLLLDGATPAAIATLRRSPPSLGEPVVIAGFPLAAFMGNELQVNPGSVNSEAGVLGDETRFSITASVQVGNSGGPVLDKYGRVIGVVVSKLNEVRMLTELGASLSNYNFAIQNDILLEFLRPYRGIEEGPEGVELDVQQIAANSREFTVQIECRP
jgi:serine protease Do